MRQGGRRRRIASLVIGIYVVVCVLGAEQHTSHEPAGGRRDPDLRSPADETNQSERRATWPIWMIGGWIVYVPLLTGFLVAKFPIRIHRVQPAYFTTVAQIVPVLAIATAVASLGPLGNFPRVVKDHPDRAAGLRTFFMTVPLALALGLGLSLVAVAAGSRSPFLAGAVGGYVIVSVVMLLLEWLTSLQLDMPGDMQAARRSRRVVSDEYTGRS